MVFAVEAALAFKNASRRDNAINFITTKLASKNLWDVAEVVPTTGLDLADTSPGVRVQIRFVDEAARDQFYDDLSAQLAGANGPVVGSWIEKHDCNHDTGGVCTRGLRQTF